jgi:hypothetical protein
MELNESKKMEGMERGVSTFSATITGQFLKQNF